MNLCFILFNKLFNSDMGDRIFPDEIYFQIGTWKGNDNFLKINTKNIFKNLSLYLSIIEKPINLLFSIDQFIFEFSKKTYQQKKSGEFFQQLKERKKLSLFYGHLTKKQLINLFNKKINYYKIKRICN